MFFTRDKTVATDTFRLVEISVPNNVKVSEFPASKKPVMQGVKPVIVGAEMLKKIKLRGDKNTPITNVLAIGHADQERVEFRTHDGSAMVFNRIEGTFPDYEKIFPKKKPRVEVSVNAEYLAGVIEQLGKLNSLNMVNIKIYDDGSPIVIEAKGNEQSGRAMVMPLRGDK